MERKRLVIRDFVRVLAYYCVISYMEQHTFLAIQSLLASDSIFGVLSGTLVLPERTFLAEDFATGASRKGVKGPIMLFKSPDTNKEPLTGRTVAVLSGPLMGSQDDNVSKLRLTTSQKPRKMVHQMIYSHISIPKSVFLTPLIYLINASAKKKNL